MKLECKECTEQLTYEGALKDLNVVIVDLEGDRYSIEDIAQQLSRFRKMLENTIGG